MAQFLDDSIRLGLDFATAPLQIGSNTVRGLRGEQPRDLWFSRKQQQQPERGRGPLANSSDTKRSQSSEPTGPQSLSWKPPQPTRAPSPEPRFGWDRQPFHLPSPNIGQQQSQSSEPSRPSQPGLHTRPSLSHQPEPINTSKPAEERPPSHTSNHELRPEPQPATEPESEPAEAEPKEAYQSAEGHSSAPAPNPNNENLSPYEQTINADLTHTLPSDPIQDHQFGSESTPPPPYLELPSKTPSGTATPSPSLESKVQTAIAEPIWNTPSDSKQKPEKEAESPAVSPDSTPLPSKTAERSRAPTKTPKSELSSKSEAPVPTPSSNNYKKPTSEPEQEMAATTYDMPKEEQDAPDMSDVDANEQAQGGRGKPSSALQSVPNGGPGLDRKRRLGPVQNPTLNKVRNEGDKDSSLKIRIELDIEVEVELWARVKGDIVIGLL